MPSATIWQQPPSDAPCRNLHDLNMQRCIIRYTLDKRLLHLVREPFLRCHHAMVPVGKQCTLCPKAPFRGASATWQTLRCHVPYARLPAAVQPSSTCRTPCRMCFRLAYASVSSHPTQGLPVNAGTCCHRSRSLLYESIAPMSRQETRANVAKLRSGYFFIPSTTYWHPHFVFIIYGQCLSRQCLHALTAHAAVDAGQGCAGRETWRVARRRLCRILQ